MKKRKGYIILKNLFNGKWVYHYYPEELDTKERIWNEYFSFVGKQKK